MNRWIAAAAALALGLAISTPVSVQAQSTTVTEDMKAAAIAYAEAKKTEILQEQSKAAITALYRKLYGSGANKTLVRTLGAVALSAEEINRLAENTAKAIYSGDPESVKAAAGQVAIGLGQTLTRAIKDPKLRKDLAGALGSVDKINEIADVLGQAAGGDSTAALEYAGRALIAATPAAGIFTAAETAVGAMKYAHGKFVDAELEDLYRRYARGDNDTRAAIRLELETSRVYTSIVGERRRELEAEKIDAISRATAEPGDRLRVKLTEASEREVVDSVLEGFAARVVRDRQAAAVAAARQQAEAEATAMLEALGSVVRNGYGKDWAKKYSFNYSRFVEIVQDRIGRDGVLDPHDRVHVAAMSRLLATRMVYGPQSSEYRDELAAFNDYRRSVVGSSGEPVPADEPPVEAVVAPPGDACSPDSRERVEADRLWQEATRLKSQSMRSSGRQKRQDEADTLKRMAESVRLCPDKKRKSDFAVWQIVLQAAQGMEDALPDLSEQTNRIRPVN